jgi:hypothetical protein
MHLLTAAPRLLLAALLLATAACQKKAEEPAVDVKDTPEPPSAPSPIATQTSASIEDFTGVYVSNFGTTVTFSQVGTTVESSLTAKHGRIVCVALGITLDCSWTNGRANGKETLVKQPDGTLKGTFGSGTSTTGGVISFAKKEAVASAGAGARAGAGTRAKSGGGSGGSECPSGQTRCPTGCENLQVSNGNCGSCGHFCPSGTVCNHKGVCTK